jgi:hypothetical protein
MDLASKIACVPQSMEHSGQAVVLVLQALVEHLRPSLLADVLQPSDRVDAIRHSDALLGGVWVTLKRRPGLSPPFPWAPGPKAWR